MSEDPIGDVDSPNLYSFVGWKPNMETDPLGLMGPGERFLSQEEIERQIANYRRAEKVRQLRNRIAELRSQIEWLKFDVAVREYLLDIPEQNRRDKLWYFFAEAGASFDENMYLSRHFLGPAGTCEKGLGEFHCGLAEAGHALDAMYNVARVVEIGFVASGLVEPLGRAATEIVASRLAAGVGFRLRRVVLARLASRLGGTQNARHINLIGPRSQELVLSGRWKLSFDKASQSWRTPGGLIYGQGSVHGNRVKHVLAHGVPDPSKPVHSVFSVSRKNILPLVDEAWAARGAALPGDPGAFVIPMGRTVGTAGETSVKIIVRPNTSEIITAYPVVP
ncbi:MAG: hypothetical protein GY835_12780 [bacterium]|nr:hypothetical protein [bacterium]